MRKFLLGFLVGAFAFPEGTLLAAAIGLFLSTQIHPLLVGRGHLRTWPAALPSGVMPPASRTRSSLRRSI